MDTTKRLGRRQFGEERLSDTLVIPIEPSVRQRLIVEAQHSGCRSLAEHVRRRLSGDGYTAGSSAS